MKQTVNVLIVLLITMMVVGAMSVQAAQSESEPALTVNGETVSKAELSKRVEAQFRRHKKAAAQSKKKNKKSPEEMRKQIREQVIQGTVRELVVRTKAEESDVTVSDTEVEDVFAKQTSKITDKQFKAILDRRNMTEQDFRERIQKQLKIRKFLDRKIGKVSVRDVTVRNYYDSQKDKLFKDKSFDEVKDRIRSSVKNRKKQQAQLSVVQKLHEESDVTINIEPGVDDEN